MNYIILFILISITAVANDTLIQKALDKGLKPIPKDFDILKSQVDDKDNPSLLLLDTKIKRIQAI